MQKRLTHGPVFEREAHNHSIPLKTYDKLSFIIDLDYIKEALYYHDKDGNLIDKTELTKSNIDLIKMALENLYTRQKVLEQMYFNSLT